MKKLLLLLASSAFVANFAVSAHADEYGGMDKKGMDNKMMGDHQMPMGKMMGMHKMTGTVEKMDAKGMMTLKTGEGDLMLHFPPAALRDIKQGDTVTVQLGIMKEGAMKK